MNYKDLSASEIKRLVKSAKAKDKRIRVNVFFDPDDWGALLIKCKELNMNLSDVIRHMIGLGFDYEGG